MVSQLRYKQIHKFENCVLLHGSGYAGRHAEFSASRLDSADWRQAAKGCARLRDAL